MINNIREQQIRHLVHYAHKLYGFNNVAVKKFIEGRFDFFNKHNPKDLWMEDEMDYAMRVFWEEIKPDEYLMYLVVNTDLNMSAGKVGAQVGHGVGNIVAMCLEGEIGYNRDHENGLQRYRKWTSQGGVMCKRDTRSGAKCVLGATQKEINDLIERYSFTGEINIVTDEGRTENTIDAVTVVALAPMKRKHAQIIVGHLHVLGYEPKEDN